MLSFLRGRGSQHIAGVFFVCVFLFFGNLFFTHQAHAAVVTWTGLGLDGQWNTGTNWSTGSKPAAADTATFDGTCGVNCAVTINTNVSITAINMASGYTGTITQSNTNTVALTGSFTLTAGTYVGSTQTLSIATTYTQTGGTFTGGSGTVTHTGAFTLSGAGAVYTASSGTTIFSSNFTHSAGTGTFTHNSGLVSITGGSTRTFDFATSETFGSVTLNKTTATSLTIASGDTMIVTGTSTLTDGNLTTGTWDARGTTSWASTFDGGTGTLLLGGSAVVAATLNSGNTAVNLSITNANVTVDTAGSGTVAVGALTMSAGVLNANAATMTYSGAVALSGGTYNAPTSGAGTTTFSSTFDQTLTGVFAGGTNAVTHTGAFTLSGAGATYTATSGTTTFSAGFTHTAGTGTFTHNNGSVKFSGSASTTNVATSEAFYNVELAKNNATLLTVSSGDTLVVNNTLTLTNGGFGTGTVEALNTISLNAGWDGGGGTLLIDGVNTQTLALNGGGAAIASTVTLNNANFTFSGTGAGTLTFSAVNLQAGTIDATGYSMTFSGAYNQSGGTFTGGSGTVTHSTFTLSNGTYTATSGTTNISTTWTHSAGTFNHGSGTISSTGGTFTMTIVDQDVFYNATFTVTNANTRTISGGTLIVANTFYFSSGGGALTGTFDLRGDITGGGTTFPGTRTISITGTADQTWSIPSGFSGTFTVDKSAGTVNQTTAITTGTWTFTAGTWNANDSGFTPNSTYTHNGGTMNFGGSTVTLGNFTFSAGTVNATTATMTVNGNWTHTAGGTFNHNNGSVSISTGTTAVDVASTETFYNLTVSPSSTRTITIANGDSCIVLGTLTLSGSNGTIAQTTKPAEGSFQLYGDLTLGASFANATTTFGFYGSATQHLTEGAAKAIGNITIDKSGGSVILDSTLDDGNTMTVTVTNGTLDLNGNAISMNATSSKLIINAGGTLKLQGGETITTTGASYPQWDAGSTIYYYGTGAAYTLKNYSGYKNVVLDGTAATTVFTLPATTSIAENLTITNGILSLAGFGLTVSGTFSNNDNVRQIGSETVSLTQDVDSGTWTYLGDGDAAADTYTLVDFGVTDYYNLIVATTDAVDIIQSAGAKAIAGTLVISSGTYDANGQTTATTGLVTLSGGTYTGGSATQTFNAGLTLTGGTYTGSSGAADVNGTLTLTTGTFTAPTSTTISGDFVKGAATFTHNSGTVTFDANTNHSITGSPSWNSLTLQDSNDNATDVVLTIEAGSTQTINGTLTLDGLDASDRLNIVSSSPTTASTFDFEGASTFSGDFLDITDSVVTDNSSGVSAPINPSNSVEGTNTTNWFSSTPAGITVSAISGNTTEAGGTATFTVVLDSQPSNDVVIGISSSDTSEGTVSAASLTFTNGNWSTPQTITVTGVNDDLDDGDIAYTVITAAATSADGNYNAINPADVAVTNTDNDTSGFTVSAISGNTTEAGGTATFTVVLTAQPTADVSIGITSDDTTEGTVSAPSLTFTAGNWSTPQTVTVTGVNDDLDDGDIAYNIITAAATSADGNYNAINPADVAVTNTDNDASGFTVSAISGNTTEAGGTATATIVLTAQPTADVTVGITSSDTTEGTVSPASVTFTSGNWSTPQTITATGVNDDLDDGDIAYSLVTAAASSADGNYNGINPADVNVTNTDNDTSGFTVSAISGNTTEAGGTATFTVVLTAQPTADVSTGISSNDTTEGTVSVASLTFTSGNWATPQTVTVTGVDDLVDDGDVAYAIVTAAASSADGNYNAINPADVTVTNTDNDTAGATASAISGHTTEAEDTATFTVVLTAQPTGDVSIPLSSSDATEGAVSPASLTFTNLNWDTPQTVTVTGVDDSLDDGDVAFSALLGAITSTDGAYSGLNPADVTVINDDNDTSGFTVSAISGNTTEAGGTATFTIVLTAQPTAGVTIGLSSSDTTEGTVAASTSFTTVNWNTPKTITVTGVDDVIDDGTVAYSIITAAASSADTNYNGLNPADVSVSNTDDDAAGFTVSAISGNTTEAGGTATFTVVLNTQPVADVIIPLSSNDTTEGTVSPSSLTFTNLNWDTPQTVTVTGVNDNLDDGDIAYSIITAAATSDDAPYSGLNPADVAVTNTDNDASGFTVSAISANTTEAGGTATFTVVLTAQPTADVSVGLSSNDTSEGTVSPASLTFTSGNWSTPQTVTVTGANDDLDDGDIAYSVVTAAASSADGNYNAINPADVAVTNTDNDVSGVTVSAISGNTTEAGGTATFTVVLDAQPTGDVVIDSATDDATEGVVTSGAILTFTSGNWSTPQTVTVTGQDDTLDDGNIAYHIVVTTDTVATNDDLYDAVNPSDVNVTNTDNDTSSVTVTQSGGTTLLTEGGATDSYTLVLTAQPTDDVVVTITPNAQVEISVPTVTFTNANWSTPQTVTVTAVDDADIETSPHSGVVSHTVASTDLNYNGAVVASVSASITDNDHVGVTVSVISGDTTEAGGTATFTVVLQNIPTDDVVVALASSDEGEGILDQTTLTFTMANWDTPQTVTVTGADDFLDDGDVGYTVLVGLITSADFRYNGFDPGDVAVTNTDNDTSGFTVSAISGNTTEAGGTATFTVVLTAQPTADVSIGISSDDTTEGTVSAASLTFTSGNWSTPQTITVTGANDDLDDGDIAYNIITAAATSADGNYNGINPADVAVTNTDNDTSGFTVSAISGNTTEAGGTATFTVVLTAQPTADVSFSVTSSSLDDGTVSTASLTFTSGNWSIPQTVTVTGVDDLIDDGDTDYVIMLSAAVSDDLLYNGQDPNDVSVTNTDNDTASVSITQPGGITSVAEGGPTDTYSVVLTSQPTADVFIDVIPNDQITTNTLFLTFTPGDWNVPQTVTVTAVDDDVAEGSHTGLIDHSPASGDALYGTMLIDSVTVSIADNDTADVFVDGDPGNTTEAGGTTTFTVVLTSSPTADVIISVTSADVTEATVNLSSLTFTSGNWSTPQVVTITGVDDLIDDGDVAYTIELGSTVSDDPLYNGLIPASVNPLNIDNDTASVAVTVSGGTTDVTEGGATDTVDVVLQTQPLASVVVSLTVGAQITTSASALTFTTDNWSTPQTVTISAVDDSVDETSPVSVTVSWATASDDSAYNALVVVNTTVAVTDNDTAAVTVTQSGGTTNVTEGGDSDAYAVVLVTKPTASVTISVVPDSELTTDVSTLTFTVDNWDTPQVVVVTAVNDSVVESSEVHSVIHISTSADPFFNGLSVSSVLVTVTDNDTTGGGGDSGGGGGGSSSGSETIDLTITNPVEGATYPTGYSLPVRWGWTGTIPAVNVYISRDDGATWTLLRYAETNDGSTTIGAVETEGQALIKVEGTNYIRVLATDTVGPFLYSASVDAPTDETGAGSGSGSTTDTESSVADRVDALPDGVSVHGLVKLADDGNLATATDSVVYYIGADGRRHVFPNGKVFLSWNCDFGQVKTIAPATLAMIPLGKNVTYRPGYKMVKFQTDPRVFAVDKDGSLRWVLDEASATALYGDQWNQHIDDISDAFYTNYVFGDILSDPSWSADTVAVDVSYPSDIMNVPGYMVVPSGSFCPDVSSAPSTVDTTTDTDGDGLTDAEEQTLGTNPIVADTDADGLSDGDEVHLYITDPSNLDTDGDGYLDGVEVKSGYDPKGSGRLVT